jgi:CelD/BcsL family acetyltransferase involved in cellulose biosynthesis
MPFAVLAAPAIDKYAFLGGPIVDRDHVAEAVRAMLDAIADDPRLPKAIVVDALGNDGAVAEALSRVFAERAMPVVELALLRRPMLRSDLDAPDYFRQAMSASTRKKLRQHRNRLSAQGALDLVTYSDAADVARVLERFLELEAASWKGRAGTALLSDPADAAFAREAIVAMAERGAARIETLELGGRIVGAQVVLMAGRGAFTWKIAHDEAFAQYSPGTLLVEGYTAKMLSDPATAFADSCSHGEDGMMASLWSGRMSVRDLCFCARPGGSLGFRMVAGLMLGERRLRRFAKRALAQTGQQRNRLRGLLRPQRR